jgi:hypothetical protein
MFNGLEDQGLDSGGFEIEFDTESLACFGGEVPALKEWGYGLGVRK